MRIYEQKDRQSFPEKNSILRFGPTKSFFMTQKDKIFQLNKLLYMQLCM
jgi:hypothetical protein